MGALFRALAWALVASALLLGPPLVLVRYVGNPLPTVIPSGDDVSFAITNGQIDAWTWIKALALIGWLAWANLAISFVVELLGALRGGKIKAIRGLGATQWFAARVVAQCSLAASLLFQSTSAVTASAALLPLPMPTIVAFVETESVDVSLDQGSVEADHRIENRFHVDVGRRDTLWGLAERHLGDGHQWEIIRDANVGRTMADGTVLPQGFIRVERGWSLIVPGLPSVETARSPAGLGSSDVTVERGDNLWRLSEKRLESTDHDPGPAEVLGYVNDVVERNDQAIDDPDLIFPGQVFTFPGLDPDDDGLPIVVNDDDGLTDAETDFGAGADVNVGIDADVDDGLGDTGPLRHELADFEVVEVAHRVGEESLSASSARGEPLRTVGSMTVGAAGALLAAGALRMMRRRRRYRMAHRTPGTVPSLPLPELDPIERALHRQGDEETLRWLHRALSSLAARPVWEGENVAQPLMATLSGDYLDVEFASADSMAAPLPWATPDDGLHWHLPRSTAVDDIPGGPVHSPIPILVTLGVDTLINLEGVGVLAVVGIGPEPMDLIRSLVHELATSIEAGIIDVRSTMPIAGTESYELVQIQSPSAMTSELVPWLDDVASKLDEAQATNAFAHRLVQGDEPLGPVVLITDSSGLAEMDELVERARRRNLPLAIVATGRAATTVTDYSIEVTAHSATIQPWDETIEPQLLTEDVAAALGELLVDARATTEEPLVTGVELSASVTDLRTRFEESSLGHTAGAAPAPAPAAGRNLDVVVLETPLDPVGDLPPPVEAIEGYIEAEPEATITIRVLGEVEAEGAPELTSQQLSMVTYLACNGASSKAALIDGLWDGQVISQSRFPNLLAEVRARIGRNHLPEVRDGRYVLSGVTTDLAEFERGVRAAQKRDDEQAMATLRSIMGLVRGVPLTPPANRFWSWVGDQTHFGARVEAMVADTAARLARLEQARGQLDRAIWACEQGLAASPTDETLTIVLTEVYLAQGKPGLARRLVDGWEDKISRMACGEPSDGPRKRLAG